MTANKPLKLRARDAEDLSVISAALQDALVPLGDMTHLPDEKTFMMVVNRFRWEGQGEDSHAERVHAGLRFDAVRRVQYRGIDRKDHSQFLSVLAVAFDAKDEKDGIVVMHFADGGAIRLEVGGLYCILADLGQPWPTQWTPEHGVE
ncbi:MAG: DUF2948 family protein [Alphaproteobacteria bacterium]|nr:DUF2948 family protein [Alphaproteobacteria bacterium]